MKIYTKTGDRGETSLSGGKRVPKHHLRIETYGTVDELNSLLGVVRAMRVRKSLDRILEKLQNDLFVLGADLAAPLKRDRNPQKIPRISVQHILALEKLIDKIEPKLQRLRKFILPGGTAAAAHLHLARAICRRAERSAVRLSRGEAVNFQAIVYLNRLSDLLFVLARLVNQQKRVREVVWVKD